MQIKTVHLKDFGKHKDRQFSFGPGTSTIRGGNEAGKSTMLLGTMYALFGSTVLDFPIEHYVNNDGATSMKVMVVFEGADGVEYLCSRGTSGAELVVAETKAVVATNHGPVTAKVEELLGVPPGKAETTIFAKQGKIQGILSLGPTALAEYIEKLAGFDSVDELIGYLTSKLNTSSAKVYQELLDQKKEQLAAVPAQVDTTPQRMEVKAAEAAALGSLEAYQAADLALKLAEQDNDKVVPKRAALEARITEYKRQEETRKRLEADLPNTTGVAEKISELESQLLAASAWFSYEQFLQVPKISQDVWEGDAASLDDEIRKVDGEVQGLRRRAAATEALISEKKKSYLASTTCPFTKEVCDKLSDLAVIERTNAEVDAEVAELTEEIAGISSAIAEGEKDSRSLSAVRTFQETLRKNLAPYAPSLEFDETVVPWGVKWVAPVPEKVDFPREDPSPLRDLLAKEERIRGQLAVLPAPVDYSTLEIELAGLTVVDTVRLKEASDTAGSALGVAEARKAAAAEALANVERANSVAEADRVRLVKEIDGLRNLLRDIAEDVAFLKAVKAARLAVAETLWQKVLAGTSRYFSLSRGKESTISRSAKGFLIDGHPIVSGSTFDLLGLALRITLTKLFSHCGILILDEPGAGADEDRSALTAGMLAGAGFDQCWVITHREADEAAGGQLITV